MYSKDMKMLFFQSPITTLNGKIVLIVFNSRNLINVPFYIVIAFSPDLLIKRPKYGTLLRETV